MKSIHLAPSLLAALLAVAASAQESAPPKTTAAAGPLAVLKTSRPDVAAGIAMMLDPTLQLPDVAEDGHYVLTLGSDRKLAVAAGTGKSAVIDLQGDPGAAMQAFAKEIEGARAMLRGAVTMGMQAQGMPPADGMKLADQILAFPAQIGRLALLVTGDPEHPREGGMDVTLTLVPKPASGFASFAEALKPNPAGVLAAGGKAPMADLRLSLAPESLTATFAPAMDWALNQMFQGDEDRARARPVLDQLMKLYDGTVSMTFDSEMRGRGLLGVVDGGKLRELLASPDYAAVMKSMQSANRQIETETTVGAFEHRGASVMRQTTTGPKNMMMPDGTMHTWMAAVGDCMVLAMGGDEAAAKAAIDTVADGKAKREPIANGAVLQFTLDVLAMAEMVTRETGGAAGDDAPEKMLMTFGKNGGGVQLHMHLQ